MNQMALKEHWLQVFKGMPKKHKVDALGVHSKNQEFLYIL